MRLDRLLPRHLCIITLMLALAGTACVQHRPPSTAPAPASDPVVSLLEYADTLANSSPDQREQAVAAARQTVAGAPGARHYARLALAYGTPSQRRYTPDEAARYARLALNADDADWSPAARRYLQQYARLYTALTQSSSTPTESRSTASDASTGTYDDNAEQRIADLKSQLAEAHRKLRELADIEDNLSAPE